MRTRAQTAGDQAEAVAAAHLVRLGWTILDRQVRVGRLEIDLVALDPGPPARLVGVEVRWRASRSFGIAEESVDPRKRARLRVAIGTLAAVRVLPDGRSLPPLPAAIDLVVVEPPRAPGQAPVVRHHRDVLA
jgi:putative endonuclease